MTERAGDPWSNFSVEQIENLRLAEEAAAIELAGFDRWMLLGSALSVLQHEAMRRSNSQNPQGRRYSDMWEWLSSRTPHLARIPKAERSDAVWLHAHREAVVAWYEALPPKRRDSLRTPRTLKRNIERDQGKAKPSAEEISKEPEIKKRGPGTAAAIDEAVIDLRNVADDLVRVNAGTEALIYDLSTPELTAESARNLIEIYTADGARRLALAVLAILDPPAPAPAPLDPAFSGSLKAPGRRKRKEAPAAVPPPAGPAPANPNEALLQRIRDYAARHPQDTVSIIVEVFRNQCSRATIEQALATSSQ
jgi:hypothetical protein